MSVPAAIKVDTYLYKLEKRMKEERNPDVKRGLHIAIHQYKKLKKLKEESQ